MSPAKRRFRVLQGVEELVKVAPSRACFLTLTFAEKVTCPREAARRFHSFATGWLSQRADGWIWVRERQRNGRWHYHLVVVFKAACGDLAAGYSRDLVRRRCWWGASDALRALWRELRVVTRRYRLGYHRLEPIWNPGGAGAYLGKYLVKSERRAEDYGVRLIGAGGIGRWVLPGCRFAWVAGPSKEWRVGMAYVSCAWLSCRVDEDWRAQAWFRGRFGPRWAWYAFRMLSPRILQAATDWWEGR